MPLRSMQKPHMEGPVAVASFTKGRFVGIAPSVEIEAQIFQMRLRNARGSRYHRRKNALAFGLIFDDAQGMQIVCVLDPLRSMQNPHLEGGPPVPLFPVSEIYP